MLGLFALLAGRAFKLGLIAFEREQVFAGAIAYGIGLWFSLQAMISIGVNLGVLPTKGLTLPFVSSGGSSVLMSCVAMGLLLRVARELAEAEREQHKPMRSPRVGMPA
ncbi:MAG: FtsW/RodA/SpoVE family cell cycle protein [Xanthomonadales bacterium]|nr:FtsW/RodA/SpoVE family cell cycle protein [Xanthomonadales bacterium]